MHFQIRLPGVLALVATVACNSAAPSAGGSSGKADEADGTSTQSVCGIEVTGLEFRGVGEVGELDLDPRLTANTIAAELNEDEDCVTQIDTCVVPNYFITEDEQDLVVSIENSEIVGARLLFHDFELVAEERFGDCTRCEGERCQGGQCLFGDTLGALLSSSAFEQTDAREVTAAAMLTATEKKQILSGLKADGITTITAAFKFVDEGLFTIREMVSKKTDLDPFVVIIFSKNEKSRAFLFTAESLELLGVVDDGKFTVCEVPNE